MIWYSVVRKCDQYFIHVVFLPVYRGCLRVYIRASVQQHPPPVPMSHQASEARDPVQAVVLHYRDGHELWDVTLPLRGEAGRRGRPQLRLPRHRVHDDQTHHWAGSARWPDSPGENAGRQSLDVQLHRALPEEAARVHKPAPHGKPHHE